MLKKLSVKAKIIAGIAAVTAVGAVVVLIIILTTAGIGKNNSLAGNATGSDAGLADAGKTADQNGTTESGEASESDSASGSEESDQTAVSSDTPITKDNPGSASVELSAEEIDAFWLRNGGYWFSTIYPNPFDNAVASDDKFVGFFKEDGIYKFEYGLYRSSFWIGGEVIKVENAGDYRVELTLLIPETPETAVDVARPERTEIIYIHEIDNSTNIRIENLGDGEWYTYEYGGMTLEEAANNQ